MLTTRWQIRLAGSISLSLVVMTVGCQSVRGEIHSSLDQPPSVPALSASPNQSLAADSTHLASAPVQLAHGTTPSSPSASPLVPALPTPAATDLPTPGLAQGSSQWSTPSTPRTLGEISGPAAKPVGSSPVPAACLPSETDWRKQMEDQTAALIKRLGHMEGELSSTRTELQTVSESLKSSQSRIEQLNQEVTHWKGEVKRLETDMRTQQLADLKSLDELTETMHQVLLRQRGHTPQREASK